MRQPLSSDREKYTTAAIEQLRREVEAMKFNQPITIIESNAAAAGPATVNNGDSASATASLDPSNEQVMLGVIQASLYKSSVSDDNFFPTGANWSSGEKASVNFEVWHDWGLADGKNIKLIQRFVNNSGSGIEILLVAAARIINNTGS